MILFVNNMQEFWQWLAGLWETLFGGYDWATSTYEFLRSFIQIFRDLFYFTF
mgnify:FL=1